MAADVKRLNVTKKDKSETKTKDKSLGKCGVCILSVECVNAKNRQQWAYANKRIGRE
jgi:hypothetical protein